MPEKTKRKNDGEKRAEEKREKTDEENWSEDQKSKSYYYDDAYGYEVYNPDEDEEEAG